MAFQGLTTFIDLLEKEGELIRIRDFVDPKLEITEITDRISKLPGGGKALLFENTGTRFPVLINAMGSVKRIAMALGRENLHSAEEEIMALFRRLTSPKTNLLDKLRMLPDLREVSSWMPEKSRGSGKCQDVTLEEPALDLLPILQCWPADGGRFITLPAVHTVDPETGAPNVGMYRMQVFDKNLTGMHWHRHKTGAVHYAKYKALGKKMPVTVTLGGDPAYIYAATAPMPENMDEYLLAGFLRKKQIRLVKCLTNDLFVPGDADFVIEGYVDPWEEMILEGPFGDHTGFYSLAGYFPRFHITCITHRKDAVYPATIVGIPPMEDAWIGKATERIFLSPIRLSMIPELTDMDLPFAGVAHNISMVRIRKTYPGQAVKVMHSLWGAGQMMFNKILIVTDDSKAQGTGYGAQGTGYGAQGTGHGAQGTGHGAQGTGYGAQGTGHGAQGTGHGAQAGSADHRRSVSDTEPKANSMQETVFQPRSLSLNEPQSEIRNPKSEIRNPKSEIVDIHDYSVIAALFRENFDPVRSLHFSKGPLDILDHSSDKYGYGSKLGIDLTRPFPEEMPEEPVSAAAGPHQDFAITGKIPGITGFRNLLPELSLPILLLSADKEHAFSKKELEKELPGIPGAELFKAVVLFDHEACLNDLFMLVWLLGGNLEPHRDISVLHTTAKTSFVLVDATVKTPLHDRFTRDWPNIVTMDDQTIAAIDKKWKKLGLGEFVPSPSQKYKTLVKGEGAIRNNG